MKQIRYLLNELAKVCHNTNYLVALELRKNKYSESDFIDKTTWIDIGIKSGAKKSMLINAWNDSN